MFRRVFNRAMMPALARRSFSTTFIKLQQQGNLPYESFAVATVREAAPSWKAKAVVNGAISEVSLADFAGKYVVMLFYPLDFTFVCPTEITAFSDRAKEFEALGAQVVAISVDSQFSHLAWVNTPRKKGGLGEMNIPIVADLTKNISRDYGVLIEEEGIALRGLFMIDPKGVLRHVSITDLGVGRSVDETLRVLQAFKHSDEHGEVVPCNWKPGSPTIDVAKAGEFFEKNN